MPQRTLANLLHEYLAPEQPRDCKEAVLEALGPVLKAAGPVVHQGKVYTATHEDKKWAVHAERRPSDKVAVPPTLDEEGQPVEADPRDPTDAELAEQWGVPLAGDFPLGEAEGEAAAEASEADEKPHKRGRAAGKAHHD
jgi:hypothetical protein